MYVKGKQTAELSWRMRPRTIGDVSLFDFSCKNFSKPVCGAINLTSSSFAAFLGKSGAAAAADEAVHVVMVTEM